MAKAKSQVRINAEKDPSYNPYCLRCPGLMRMIAVEPMLWRCKCGAVHDERDNAAQPAPRMCVCIAWHADRGLHNHIHYLDMLPSDVQKILNRKHEKELTARSTFMEIRYTQEPCYPQSKAIDALRKDPV